MFYLSGGATASSNRAPKGLGGIVREEFAFPGATNWRDSSFLQKCHALLFNRHRLAATGPTIRRRRIVPPGSVALAGSDSPILGRSLSINGIKTSYALPRGATSFIIRLPGPAKDRSFTFVNENAVAEGQLLIAVSNQPLVADSPLWSAVEGAIRFRHKRFFALSLVGVEAKYVRLTFQIEAPDGNTKDDFPSITFGAKIRGHLTRLCSERSLSAAQSSTTATLRP